MGNSSFTHVRVSGITTVIPEQCIAIDDEIEFFNNDPKLLERNKKGPETCHISPSKT